MKTNAAPSKEILIAVMGATGRIKTLLKIHRASTKKVAGAGKSYFIREVSGCAEVKVSDGLRSWATITLVDTPGFNDTTRTDTDILTEISGWTSKTFKENRLLSGIIYLHSITNVRMDGSAVKNLMMFQKLCGRGALKNVFLTTTQWSRVTDQAKGEVRERALCEERNFWGLLIERGATLQRFHGTGESGMGLIDQLMPNKPAALDIQEQLVTEKRTLVGTDAGRCINEELIAQEEKYKEEIKGLESEREEAIKEKDAEMKELIAEELAKTRERLEKATAEMKHLVEMHTEEMRKRDAERQRDEKRRKEEQREAQAKLEKAEAEKKLQAESHAAEMRDRERREEKRRNDDQEREERRRQEDQAREDKRRREDQERREKEERERREDQERREKEERERREDRERADSLASRRIGLQFGPIGFHLQF
ncbi:unnamed protein product [Tuber aestivum]|uniref:G domain-containing protein n=1 Tax=Tuber aestivum TaxID=59557 RepID=A0A292PW56_9PEZI|nr:unnamed protein product [Tuber aestivum]